MKSKKHCMPIAANFRVSARIMGSLAESNSSTMAEGTNYKKPLLAKSILK
jgi:hypothetical protein